jgi:hypothetical protein
MFVPVVAVSANPPPQKLVGADGQSALVTGRWRRGTLKYHYVTNTIMAMEHISGALVVRDRRFMLVLVEAPNETEC